MMYLAYTHHALHVLDASAGGGTGQGNVNGEWIGFMGKGNTGGELK